MLPKFHPEDWVIYKLNDIEKRLGQIKGASYRRSLHEDDFKWSYWIDKTSVEEGNITHIFKNVKYEEVN